MKFFLIALFTVCYCAMAAAQDKLPNFGKIDKADLEMNTCSFDLDASAMLLIDRGEVNYNFTSGDMFIQTDIRQRLKILKEDGINRADIKLNYYSKDRYEEISNLEGYVYNLDAKGNVVATKLDKTAFYNKQIDDKFSEIAIIFPQVKVGSVVEYSYRSYKKNNFSGIRDWSFQGSIPCRYSEYLLYLPQYFEFTYQVTRRQPLEFKAPIASNPCYFYAMRNIPALQQEPYMNGYNDYIQKIEFQLSSVTYPSGEKKSYRETWEKLSEELLDNEHFGLEINKNIPHTEDLQFKLKLLRDTLEKMKAVYNYVQKNMEWDRTDRLYSMDGIKKAWDKKRGSTADINLLLVDLLKTAGVKAYPMLVSTKQNGKVNIEYPYLYQFNEVMAYVEVGGVPYCLNAADKINPYFLIPVTVQATKSFVVDKVNFGWKSLTSPDQKFKQSINILANLDSSGNFSGEVFATSFDYARNAAINANKNGLSEKLFTASGITPDSVEVKYEADDSLPLEQKVSFHGRVDKSGNYYFMPYSLFSGLPEKMPFTAESRESDIDFNYLQSYSINGSYIIPEGFAFEGLPKNMALIMPDTSIVLKRIIQVSNDNMVSFRITIDFNRIKYGAAEYPDLKDYFKKMYTLLDEKIVVTKK